MRLSQVKKNLFLGWRACLSLVLGEHSTGGLADPGPPSGAPTLVTNKQKSKLMSNAPFVKNCKSDAEEGAPAGRGRPIRQDGGRRASRQDGALEVGARDQGRP